MAEQRIASLLPSSTEIACALGFRDQLVGRSHECDHPPGVEALPVCTRAKIADGTSREIDDRVKQLVRSALSVYEVDAELLRELAPSAILTQTHCEVCAVSLSDVEAAVRDWTAGRPLIVSLNPTSLAEVWRDFVLVGEALGAAARARALAAELGRRLAAVGERTGGLRDRPTVAAIEWIEPLMSAGNWLPELVTLAGGENVFGAHGEHSGWLDWNALRAADPDVIVLLPCGFDLARTRHELPPLLAREGFAALRAVRNERVYLVDGNAYFNRPGPRLVESLEILAEILHPEIFEPDRSRGHVGWERL